MKASKNIKIALIVVLGALIVVALAAWQRGGTVASLWSERPPVARRELQELDKKIKPVAERRAKIREQLNKIESKEQEARDAAAAALKSMSSGERASVEQDMRAGKLSSENAKKRAAVVAFSEYQQAYSLRRQTQALRDGLEKYELELVRALAERDRLEQRAEMVETLGYDPEDAASEEIDYGLLDDLAAQTDDSLASQAARDAALTPEDVAESSADDRAELVAEILEGRTVAETSPFEDELSARLDALAVAEVPQKESRNLFVKKTVLVPIGIGIVAAAFLAFGISLLRNQDAAPVVSPFAQQPQQQLRVQPRNALNTERVLLVVFLTFIGSIFGPIGAILGLLAGLMTSSGALVLRILGALGFLFLAGVLGIIALISLVVVLFF
jgi:hypothetical protein